MRVLLINRKLATDKACMLLQIPYHHRSFADVVIYVVHHNSFYGRKRKTHVAPICDGSVKWEISLISQMLQAATMVHEQA